MTFHSEVTQFLIRKTSSEGYDPLVETEDFSETIARYHEIEAGGPIHLERKLLESFSYEEFKELKLESYFPRLYRGLPRLYNREKPSLSRLKPGFSSLPHLKKLAVDRALFSLYRGKAPLEQARVALFVKAMADGFGDLTAALEVATIFSEAGVGGIDLFIFSEKKIPFPFSPPNRCHIEFVRKAEIPDPDGYDLLLQVPTFCPEIQRGEALGEYGFVESAPYLPGTGNRALGLHFLEKGILIRTQSAGEFLHPLLRESARSYFAYLSNPKAGFVYLHALLKSLEGDSSPIDLWLPDLLWVVERLRMAQPLLEKPYGVKAIEIYFQGQTYHSSIANQGKLLRLICPGPLSPADTRALLKKCAPFAGVRGNQSLSEAISEGKMFFYDGRAHSRFFVKDLHALAENRLRSFPGTLRCLRAMRKLFIDQLPLSIDEQWVDEIYFEKEEEPLDPLALAEEIGEALKDPKTLLGYQTLCQILREEGSANPFLIHLAYRALYHKKNPSIAAFEAEQIESYITDKQSFKSTIEALRVALREG